MPRSDWYTDSDPRALEVQGMLNLTRMVFETAQAEIRRRHPGIGEREVFLRAAARHLDRETMIRVYGADPESAPA